jgi:hypothetical protein
VKCRLTSPATSIRHVLTSNVGIEKWLLTKKASFDVMPELRAAIGVSTFGWISIAGLFKRGSLQLGNI